MKKDYSVLLIQLDGNLASDVCLYDRARNITKEASNLETEKAHLSGLVPYSGMDTRQPLSEQHRRKASLENATPKKHRERASLR